MHMFNEKFKEVLTKEGAVAIVTWTQGNAHVSNTWNSYLRVPEDGLLLIPAAGLKETEENIKANKNVKITLGSKEVEGLYGPGAGFLLEGTAEFIYQGAVYDEMLEAFPFMNRVLAVTVSSIKQTV